MVMKLCTDLPQMKTSVSSSGMSLCALVVFWVTSTLGCNYLKMCDDELTNDQPWTLNNKLCATIQSPDLTDQQCNEYASGI